MWSNEGTLLLSSPNGGGLAVLDNGQWRVIDRASTTGLGTDGKLLVRSVQHADHADFILQHRDGSANRLQYKDISDIHDVFVVNGYIYAVSTGTNEVVCLHAGSSAVVSRWKYPGEPDSMHLNGLGRWRGRLVVSAFGRFAKHREYIGKSSLTGLVMDVQTTASVWDQLTEPHSPTSSGSHFFICDSGTGRLFISDGTAVWAKIPLGGYPRGLAVTDRSIAVGISRLRKSPQAGGGSVKMLDRRTLQQVGEIPAPFPEIYDLRMIPSRLAAALRPI